MRILLTGGAGFVGSACLRSLLRHGHEGVAFDNLTIGHAESVPDGRYVVRVEASDEAANAEERALRDARESAPLYVDHRKPEVTLETARDGGALRVKGRAVDALSPIARLEVSVDGGDWHALFPVDRIFDARVEAFEFAPGDLPPGVHVVTVRAVDVENNVGSAALTVTVP